MQRFSRTQVVDVLKAGKPAIFPTDTVYGLGVAVDFAPTPEALFSLKHRFGAKPVAWLVGGVADLTNYGQGVADYAVRLAQTFWPGALTLVVKASARVPMVYQSHEGTIGLRMPNNAQTLALIKDVGCPLATTSANFAGGHAPQALGEIDPALACEVGAVLAGAHGAALSGVASTVVDCTGAQPHILRQGDICI